MKEAFIHIGAHKTASTFLQMNLKQHSEVLARDHGLALITRDQLLSTRFAEEVYAVSQGRHPAGEQSAASRESLSRLLPSDKSILITNEDLICHLEIQDFYQNARVATQYLRDILADFDLHILFYVRKQADYLESIYVQFVHLGRRLKFGQFMNCAGSVDLSWLRAVEEIESVLAAGRLHLRTYEQIHGLGETGFYRDFLSSCGIESVENFEVDQTFSRGRPANRSYGKLGLEIAQRVNPILSPKERKVFRRFLQEHFSTATHPRAELLNEEQRQSIFERFRESNKQMFDRFDLRADGHELGYF